MKTKFQRNEFFLKDFYSKLSPELVTIILNDLAEFPLLRDNRISSGQISNEKAGRSALYMRFLKR
jgi:hypothetical protein